MIGVVLSGGHSTRMSVGGGTDKGLLNYRGTPWFIYLAQLLEKFCDGVAISVRDDQAEEYRNIAELEAGLVFIADEFKFAGPAAGLISAHAAFPAAVLMVIAVDMIQMTTDVLSVLNQEFLSRSAKETCVYETAGQLQPLCGIYLPESLALIAKELNQNPDQGIKKILGRIPIHRVESADRIEFVQLNSPDDLAKVGLD